MYTDNICIKRVYTSGTYQCTCVPPIERGCGSASARRTRLHSALLTRRGRARIYYAIIYINTNTIKSNIISRIMQHTCYSSSITDHQPGPVRPHHHVRLEVYTYLLFKTKQAIINLLKAYSSIISICHSLQPAHSGSEGLIVLNHTSDLSGLIAPQRAPRVGV